VINENIGFGNAHKKQKEVSNLRKAFGAEQVSGVAFKTAI